MTKPRFGAIYSRLHDVIAPARYAALIERLGYDAVWMTDGLVNQLANLDPFVALAGLAAGSERITVGSCVIIAPLRHPAHLAKAAASIDRLSGGRFVLGIGVGGSTLSQPADYRMIGIDQRERGARCDEQIAVMKALWSGERVSHRGRFYSFEDTYMHPVPVRKPHPPIWIGGGSDGAVRRAARFGDGFVPISEGVERYTAQLSLLRKTAAEAGRDPSSIVPAVHLYYCMAGSRAEAQAIVEKTLSERYGYAVKFPNDARFPFGTAEDCARVIESYQATGVVEFVVNPVSPLAEVPGQIERFAERVLPRFR